MHNAFNLAAIEYGSVDDWTILQNDLGTAKSSEEFVKKYMQPYIKNLKVYHSSNLVGCKNITYKNLNGSVVKCNSVNGFCETCRTSGGGINMTQLHMTNGAIVSVLTRYEEIAEIYIDTNGYKGPNTWGKDIFEFNLFKPSWAKAKCLSRKMSTIFGNICHTREWTMENRCNKNIQQNCGSVIIHDGWIMKDDYPWK